jgi:hypothetical protein
MSDCDDCGKTATHVMATGLDGDTPRRYARQTLAEEVFFCTACAEEHPSAEPLPTLDDMAFDQGLDDWQD